MAAHLERSPVRDESPAVVRPLLSSLRAFVGAARRPPTALARAIVTVLTIKLVAVTGMFVFFYFTKQHVTADAAAIGRLIGPASLP